MSYAIDPSLEPGIPRDGRGAVAQRMADRWGALLGVAAAGCAGGAVQPREASRVEALGEWLAVNREAVVGTRPWVDAGSGDAGGSSAPEEDVVDAEFSEVDDEKKG